MTPSFGFTRAIVRRPAASFHRGLTTQAGAAAGDIGRFLRQHAAYVDALRGAGLEVEVLEPLADFPDAQFVEDVAVIVPGAIVLTRPGAAARRDEPRHIEAALGAHGELLRLETPGTLDGGDVLIVGRRCFIGRSARTNAAGIRQLFAVLEPLGYVCTAITVAAGLHLKSSVTAIAEDTLMVTGPLAADKAFRDFRRVVVESDEAYSANLLRVNDCLLLPQGFDRTRERIEALKLGVEIVVLDCSEARRMDGGLTCMSLRF
jgi:dimethylargininase